MSAEKIPQLMSEEVPDAVSEAFKDSARYFPTPIQQFQFFDKYSRFDDELGRRETWSETVDRTVKFLTKLSENKLPPEDYQKIQESILNMEATPSMRLLAMAGPAAERQNAVIYNCSYIPVDSPESWTEALTISMAGCGVGFSVEKQYVDKLPEVKKQTGEHLGSFAIPDDTEGWAEATRRGFTTWFNGRDIDFDYSNIRPAGVPLRVKGGRASGPEPLRAMLDFAREKILSRQGGRLSSLDAHDIMCEIGTAAVSGGMRRTAMLSLFDFDDEEMLSCKNGDLNGNERRWNANNSAVLPPDIAKEDLKEFFHEMDRGQRGEPGIFSREAVKKTRPERRKSAEFGTNPCGEIGLRPFEFCNLTIAIAREYDSVESMRKKVEVATMIGTIQSMATHFPGLRPLWKQNCEEERLLGVDITGQMDTNIFTPAVLEELKQLAVDTNRKYAEILGISPSAAVTCNKPSGNSSQLFNCASGIHARWAPYYIRSIRVSSEGPIFKVLKDAGVPMNPENGQTTENANTWVVQFPVKSPEGAITRHDLTAIDQCENWLKNKVHWTEHNPSCTITYQPHELQGLIDWVWEHKDILGGLSFLPAFDANYDQMPYVEITKEKYEALANSFPEIDFSRLYVYEKEDLTSIVQEVACVAGVCEVENFPLPNT